MGKMPWLKLYTEIRTDPKMQALSDAEFRIWINLLCLAAESNVRGVICIEHGIPYPDEALAKVMFTDTVTFKNSLEIFEKLRMIEIDDDGTIRLINFDDRQYDKPSDKPEAVAERVKKHRAKKEAEKQEHDDNVTPLKRDCNALDKDIDLDKESLDDVDDGMHEQKNPAQVWEQETGRPLSPIEIQKINAFMTDDGLAVEVVAKAMEKAVLLGHVNLKYVDGIICKWISAGVKTLADIERIDAQFQKRKQTKPTARSPGPEYEDLTKRWRNEGVIPDG